MATITTLAQAGVGFVVCWVSWKVMKKFVTKSPWDNVPGPASHSWFMGNMGPLLDRTWDFYYDLVYKYPGVVRLHGLLGDSLLFVHDPLALHHIVVKEQYIYEETPIFLTWNKLFFGEGLLATVGEHHKHQRKLLNPVFHTNHMRHMTPIFYNITHKLKTTIRSQLANGPREIDMLNWMTRAALEMVGEGGLGHSFDPLDKDELNPFVEAIKALIPTTGPLFLIAHFLPFLTTVGTPAFRRKMLMMIPWARLQKARGICDMLSETSIEILAKKREALAKGDEALMHQVGEGKDIMSVLLKANLTASEEDKLPDNELLGHISTLLFAAMETTSGALAHILNKLAEHQDVQDKLRKEVAEARAHGDIDFDELMNLPYLEAVCRETLRLYSPLPTLNRKVTKDTVLPLSTPIQGKDGSMMTEIPIPKGSDIIIAMLASNINPALWGDDAHLWKPERWLEPLPEAIAQAHIPGIYSNLMTFLGGGRACIGFKFSQLEMKVVLSVLVETFKFELVPGKDIYWNCAGIQFPTAGDTTGASEKSSLPLKVSLVNP